MKKLLLLFLSVFTVTLFLTSYWVYEHAGLKYYLKAISAINKLPAIEKADVKESFFGTAQPENTYNGVLISVDRNGYGGVWVWGRKGPKYFKADEYAAFSVYDACNEQILNALQTNNEVIIGRTVDFDIKIWAEKVKQGDFMTVTITSKEQGGTPGNLREAKAHGWWAFMPINITEQCVK